MPLQAGVPTDGDEKHTYLKRVRIAVNSELRDSINSRDQFDFIFPLSSVFENIASIELVDYNISGSHQRTFRDVAPVNNTISVTLGTVSGPVLNFDVTLTPQTQSTPYTQAQLAAQLTIDLNTAMDATGDAYYNTAVFEWVVTTLATTNAKGVANALNFAVVDTHTVVEVGATFNFGQPPIGGAAVVLGFPDENTSAFTVGATVYNYPVPSFAPTLIVDRYIDVFVGEFIEHSPVARVFITNDTDFKRNKWSVQAPRLLTDPIRRLDKLSVRLTLPGGRKPLRYIKGGIDLIFELLIVSNEATLPPWLIQTLAI